MQFTVSDSEYETRLSNLFSVLSGNPRRLQIESPQPYRMLLSKRAGALSKCKFEICVDILEADKKQNKDLVIVSIDNKFFSTKL
jgi:hypothetical protein